MVEVAVVGASGYGGGELLRLLSRHPQARLRCAVSETYTGKPISTAFPGLAGATPLRFESYEDGANVAQCDVVFLAQENGKAMQTAPHLLEAGCKVIDLSADFRLETQAFEEWYKIQHTAPQWNQKAAYGLPELFHQEVCNASLIANPGCYPTATILALAPLMDRNRFGGDRLIDPASLIVDAKSGVSGAGRAKFSLDYHFPEVNESVSAYKVAGSHRHTPEIERVLSRLSDAPVTISFTPHLIPMTRGILATCYANLKESIQTEDLVKLYCDYYADSPFVVILPDSLPATKHTLGTNYCHIGAAVDVRTRRVTVISAIDNLVKGAAGQAIQNMNLMCGFEEMTGLDFGGIWP